MSPQLGLNQWPIDLQSIALPLSYIGSNIIIYYYLLYSDSGGVRTHEAYAEDLKSSPFDHSGTLPCLPPELNQGTFSLFRTNVLPLN